MNTALSLKLFPKLISGPDTAWRGMPCLYFIEFAFQRPTLAVSICIYSQTVPRSLRATGSAVAYCVFRALSLVLRKETRTGRGPSIPTTRQPSGDGAPMCTLSCCVRMSRWFGCPTTAVLVPSFAPWFGFFTNVRLIASVVCTLLFPQRSRGTW